MISAASLGQNISIYEWVPRFHHLWTTTTSSETNVEEISGTLTIHQEDLWGSSQNGNPQSSPWVSILFHGRLWLGWFGGYPGDLGHLHFLGDRTLTVKPRISCLPEIAALPKGLELQELGSSRNLPVIIRKLLNSHGSIPINTIFSGMNIHLPAILEFTRYQGFDPSPYGNIWKPWPSEIHLPSGYD